MPYSGQLRNREITRHETLRSSVGKERLSSHPIPSPTLTLYYFAYGSRLVVSRFPNSPYSAIAGDILQDVYGSCDVRPGLAVHNEGTRIIPTNLIHLLHFQFLFHFSAIVFFLLPLSVIFILYMLIAFHVTTRRKRLHLIRADSTEEAHFRVTIILCRLYNSTTNSIQWI